MFFEDFHVGEVFEIEPVTITGEELHVFASQYDPQPIHVDTGMDYIKWPAPVYPGDTLYTKESQSCRSNSVLST
ncbi:hypothetical protein JZ785_03625 [Alicyclobacillus curvatus]|nr:hypothetical protein JZ785_03625 [Alicyclobacillus curvatus]